MNKLDALKKVEKNVRGAIEVMKPIVSEMTKRQKLAWQNEIGNHLDTIEHNIQAIEKRAMKIKTKKKHDPLPKSMTDFLQF